MPLHELDSADALKAFLQDESSVIVCFSATWCGPCKASKPTLEALADEMANKIKIGIVYEHNLKESIHDYNVRAFPTYVLYADKGTEQNRVEGANFEAIREMIASAKTSSSFDGTGNSLGGSNLSAREARLARLGGGGATTAAADESTKEDDVDMKDATKAEDEKPDAKKEEEKSDVTMENAEEESIPVDDAKEEEVDPTESLDKGLLGQLTSAMGFSLLLAQKGLLNSNGTIDGAIEWISQHQDDDDIDDPIPKQKPGKTYTPEEKAAKIQEIKDLLKARRADREEAEKVDNVDREKQRRFMGKEIAKTREDMEREQRKREAMVRKREKDAFKRERERLRAELARDKLERQKNKGKLKSALGADGYNPSIIQYDDDKDQDNEATSAAAKKKIKADPSKIDSYIEKVSSYRAGGDGGKCLKILLAYVSNVVNNPDEAKFRTINMENQAFKSKVKPFVGAKPLLMAVGFQKPEGIGNEVLVLSDDAERDTLAETKTKLEKALEAYGK